jgi:hypothetical protein
VATPCAVVQVAIVAGGAIWFAVVQMGGREGAESVPIGAAGLYSEKAVRAAKGRRM